MNEVFHPALAAPSEQLNSFEWIHPARVPSPYHEKLVNEEHFTKTVSDIHGPVGVKVKQVIHSTNEKYSRRIFLTSPVDKSSVAFAILHADLHKLPKAVSQGPLASSHPVDVQDL